MDQFGITFFGLMAIWLSQDRSSKCQKYAPIFGLISQPFWFYSSWIAGQWGIFALSVLYTVCWLKGIKNYWCKPAVINKLKCLLGYHDWKSTGFECSDFTIKAWFFYKCSRCGKEAKEYR